MKCDLFTIIRAIKENSLRTPEDISSSLGQALSHIESALIELEHHGYISILRGGSKKIWAFEILKPLPELT